MKFGIWHNSKVQNLNLKFIFKNFSTESPKTALTVWFEVSWKRLYLHNLFLYFLKSSYFNLKFGIKQSKIGWKFAEQWLPKVKISEPVDDRRPDFFEKCTN